MNEYHAFLFLIIFYYGQEITSSSSWESSNNTQLYYMCIYMSMFVDQARPSTHCHTTPNSSHYINVPAQCCKTVN